MVSRKTQIWKREGSTGILSLVTTAGSYLDDPEFFDMEWLRKRLDEPRLKGIIVRGSGRHFSAGADIENLRELAKDKALLSRKMNSGKQIIKLIESSPLPFIAEIKGICFGGGLEIALACHMRICSDTALFAFPETNHGIMPGLGGTINLARLVGPGKAVEMILTGDSINADKALEMNLVDYVAPREEISDFTIKLMDKMTIDRDVEVIRSVMRSIHNSYQMDRDEALEEETRLFCALALKNFGK